MNDQDKTKAELLNELMEMRQRIAKFQGSPVTLKQQQQQAPRPSGMVPDSPSAVEQEGDITVRREVESAERQREAYLMAIIENQPGLVWLKDKDSKFLAVNCEFARSCGRGTPEDVVGKTDLDVWPKELAEKYRYDDKMVMETGKLSMVEEPILDKGETKWFETFKTPVWDADENVVGTTGYARDITKRKRAEESLREASAFLDTLLDAIPAPVFYKDTNGRYIGFNKSYEEFYGKTRQDLVGKSVFDIAPRELAEVYHAKDLELFHNPGIQVYDSQVKDARGAVHDVVFHKSTFSDLQGHVLGLIGVILDITERKKAEEAADRANQEWERTFNTISHLIMVLDDQHKILRANKAMAEALGMTEQELIGKSCFELVHGEKEPPAFCPHSQLLADGEEHSAEVAEPRLGGIYDVRVSPLVGQNGQVIGSVHVTSDITERKRAEEMRDQLRNQLAQAQKMEAIGTLTGGIAHDFNNLLTIINGYTELILSERTEDDPNYSDLQKILETGRKGADLVQRLLSFSKKAEIGLRPLDLNGIVINSVRLMERTFPKIIQIETILAKDLCQVNADAVQVEQVLMNLCINAKEAMPDGGKLRVEIGNVTVDEAYCKLHVGAKSGRYVLIEVSDTGVGVGKETMERIFDPFFTTKGWDFKKGTGLGLSVAKGIMEQHHGWITCDSEPGKGTTFGLYFAATDELPEVQMPAPLTGTFPGTETILLVDDEKLVRDLGKRILEHSGYTVITATNGKEALEIYSREKSKIGLVVLDLIMPEMGGDKCLDELLRIDPQVKVIVSSGHSLDPKGLECLGAYAKGFVNKPYQMREFMEVVRGVLNAV
ncbi:MAG: PAS domain-containing protein [Pseudomonadota bacterium]